MAKLGEIPPETKAKLLIYGVELPRHFYSLKPSDFPPLQDIFSYDEFDPSKYSSKLMGKPGPKWVTAEMSLILASFVVLGNICSKHLEKMTDRFRNMLLEAMQKFEIKIHDKDVKLSKNELDTARFVSMFPAEMYLAHKSVRGRPHLSRILSPSVLAKVPDSLCFLEVGSLACAIVSEEEKAKLIAIARLVNNDYQKNLAKLTNSEYRDDFEKVLKRQLSPSTLMREMIVSSVLWAGDLSFQLEKFQYAY